MTIYNKQHREECRQLGTEVHCRHWVGLQSAKAEKIHCEV